MVQEMANSCHWQSTGHQAVAGNLVPELFILPGTSMYDTAHGRRRRWRQLGRFWLRLWIEVWLQDGAGVVLTWQVGHVVNGLERLGDVGLKPTAIEPGRHHVVDHAHARRQ